MRLFTNPPNPEMHPEWMPWAVSFRRWLIQAFIEDQREGQLAEYTVATLPSPTQSGIMVYVVDASGGSIPAFSDGAAWRRVDTRAVVT